MIDDHEIFQLILVKMGKDFLWMTAGQHLTLDPVLLAFLNVTLCLVFPSLVTKTVRTLL